MHRDCCRKDTSVRRGAWNAAVVVCAIAASLLLVGRSIVGEMMHKTKGIGWHTPDGSASVVAKEKVQKLFPHRMRGAIVMAVEALPGTSTVLTDAVAAFSRNVSRRVAEDSRVKPFRPYVIGYYLDAPGEMQKVVQSEMVSNDEKMTAILIQPTKMDGQSEDANKFLEEFCRSPPPGFTLHITGMLAVISGDGCFKGVHGHVNTRDMNFKEIQRAELWTIPVALLIIGKLVKYYIKLLLIPVLIVAVTFVISSGMMIPWMDSISVPHDAPAAMGSMTIALAMDYGLFFLSRFSEQHTQGWLLQDNVDTLVRCTGKTITVSGTLIAVAFFGTLVLPEANLKGTGALMGIATVSGVLTSITLIPAVLLVAGRFLTGNVVIKPVDIDMQGFNQRQDLDVFDPGAKAFKEDSHWLRAVRLLDRNPKGAIGAVLLLMSPILWSLPYLRITGDRFALMPMNMPAMSALHHVQQHFPLGVLDPYAIVIQAPKSADDADLEKEVKAAAGSLHLATLVTRPETQRLFAQFGLDHRKAVALQAGLNDIHKHGIDTKAMAATVRKTDCATLAALSAGSASAVDKAHGAEDVHALRLAVHAAHGTGCSSSDVQKAVAATVALLYTNKTGQIPSDAIDAVKEEGLKLGLSKTEAAQLALAAHEASKVLKGHEAMLAAARAGAAAGIGKLKGHEDVTTLKDALNSMKDSHISIGDVARVLRAASVAHQQDLLTGGQGRKKLEVEAKRHGVSQQVILAFAASFMAAHKEGVDVKGSKLSFALPNSTKRIVGNRAHAVESAAADRGKALDETVRKRWSQALDIAAAAVRLAGEARGTLLMPTGFEAMSDLCSAVHKVGSVASMVSPSLVLHKNIDWPMAVAMQLNATTRGLYKKLLDSHVNGNAALLEVHTSFPSIGAGGADWVIDTRKALVAWQESHPGFTAVLSGGATEAADTRSAVLEKMWSYLGISVFLIMVIVYLTFESVMIPLRLAFALFFTMAATYGVAVVIYQTPLLHGIFPWLAPFHGLTFEVVPSVTGVAIALGLDYDIFLVSRVVEYRLQGFSDRASVFRGSTKAGGVISGAGIIMALAFTGLCFSDKLIMQQFGVLLITSVLFDTFVVRTVLVPALMLVADEWNWWPRRMPMVTNYTLEGEVDIDHASEVEKPYLDIDYLNRLQNSQYELENPLLGGI